MAVIHIFKDGTVKTELKNVYVPTEIVKQVIAIAARGPERKDRNEKAGV